MLSLTLSLHSRPCLCCFSGEMLILHCFTSAFGSICDNCVSDHHNLAQLLHPREREPQKHMGLEKMVCFTAHGPISETTDSLVFHRKDMAPQNILEVKSRLWFVFPQPLLQKYNNYSKTSVSVVKILIIIYAMTNPSCAFTMDCFYQEKRPVIFFCWRCWFPEQMGTHMQTPTHVYTLGLKVTDWSAHVKIGVALHLA